MSQAQLAPVDQSKLRETVYDALKQAFTRGSFAPGDVLSLRVLAAQLGVSMTPVREAVRRLVAEGALIDTPSRTLMVPPFDARRMSDLKSARMALETLVLDQAIERMTPALLSELEQMIETQISDGSGPDLELNYRFHFALYRHSESEVLLPMIEALWMQYGGYLNLIIRENAASQIDEHKHHHEIIAALKARDSSAARDALQQDIDRSFRVLLPDTQTGSSS